MKVFAVNSSARTGHSSKTQLMLDALVEGMRDAGAEVEVVNLKDKKIKVCVGCFSCWTTTQGKCIHKDDMSAELFDKWLASDLCVYATPLFHHTVNATMKAFIERTLPSIEPYQIKEGDRWVHPLRHETLPGAMVLSVAGFPEMSAFGALQHYTKFLFGQQEGVLWGEIYRPGAEIMPFSIRKYEILDATRQAGKELAKNRKISSKTQARVEQPIGSDMDDLANLTNMYWDTCIDQEISPREFNKKDMIPRPKDTRGFLQVMKIGFKPARAGDTKAVLQFDFSGSVADSCHMVIKDGKLSCAQGKADKPDLTVSTPFDLWMDITGGQQDGGQCFMDQKYTAQGDMDLLLKMGSFFGRRA